MDAVQTAIKDKIIVVQGRQVILDSDVAALYGVETKRVNEAIKNNPDKFPDGYILQLTPSEWEDLRSKISTTKSAKVRYAPKAFTEKGLYAGDDPEIACCHADDNRDYRNLCKGERTVPHNVGVARSCRPASARRTCRERQPHHQRFAGRCF